MRVICDPFLNNNKNTQHWELAPNWGSHGENGMDIVREPRTEAVRRGPEPQPCRQFLRPTDTGSKRIEVWQDRGMEWEVWSNFAVPGWLTLVCRHLATSTDRLEYASNTRNVAANLQIVTIVEHNIRKSFKIYFENLLKTQSNFLYMIKRKVLPDMRTFASYYVHGWLL